MNEHQDEKRNEIGGVGRTQSMPRRRRWLVGAAILGAIGSLAAWRAAAHEGPHRWFGGGWHGRHDPARMAEHAEWMSDRLMAKLGGNQAQTEKARAIARATAADLQVLAQTQRETRKAFLDTLGADTVDRARLETLRSDTLHRADQASLRVAQAIGDLSEVLTVEQRRKLVEHLGRHRS